MLHVPGLDSVPSGRGVWSYASAAYFSGQQYHPVVMEAERKVIEASLSRAGKIAGPSQYYPLQDGKATLSLSATTSSRVCSASPLDRTSDIVQVYRNLVKELHSL